MIEADCVAGVKDKPFAVVVTFREEKLRGAWRTFSKGSLEFACHAPTITEGTRNGGRPSRLQTTFTVADLSQSCRT